MKEKLIIKNFGPIKLAELELGRFNVLIGEQSTGKSTVVKLVAAINSMAQGETLAGGGIGLMRKDEYGTTAHLKRHLSVYKIEDYITETSEIKYNGTLFHFHYFNGNSAVTKLKELENGDDDLSNINVIFIPADRLAVILLTNEVLYTLNDLKEDLPDYFTRFGRLFHRSKRKLGTYDFYDTIGVKYKYDEGLDKVVLKNEKEIYISEASSAIQTNVPMLVVLEYLSMIHSANETFGSVDSKIIVIEEPELNCFPSLQKDILSYILRSVRKKESSFFRKVFITTHSPYVLTTLNNLLYAYKTGQEHKDETNKIIKEQYWLNRDDVSAYMMMPDGTCEDIVDKEEGLIKAEKIDGVSESLNQEFSALLDIEFEKR